MNLKATFGAASIAALLLTATSANAVIVDLFEHPVGGHGASDAGAVDGVGASSTAGPFPDTIIGGYRTLYVEKIGGPDGGDLGEPTSLESTLAVTEGALRFSNADEVIGFGQVTWDGNGEGLGSFINQEGCGDGCSDLVFDVLSADLAFQFEIVFSDGTATSTLLGTSPGVPVGSPQTFPIPFDTWNQFTGTDQDDGIDIGFDYTIANDGFVNFDNVSSLILRLNVGEGAIANLDMGIASITKNGVPTPATLALLAAGLLGIGAAARRRNGVRG
jgi:hypothetical protein